MAEDTVPVPRVWLKELQVRARRLTLDEILDRIAAGEARRDSSIQDEVYDVYVRVLSGGRRGELRRKTELEQVSRVYLQRPDRHREMILRRSGREDIQVQAGPSMREEIIKFAFDPRLRKQYRFQIVGRDFAGGHIIYRLNFEPRSQFYKLPSGRLWVDTNDFVILREEFWYRGPSPLPLILKSLDDCVVERTLVDGRYWVIGQILARVSFALPVLGIPPQGDLLLSYQNYRINRGIEPSVFQGPGEGSR